MPRASLAQAIAAIERHKDRIGYAKLIHDDAVAKVSIVGAGMIDRPGIAADMFRALSDGGINIKMISTSEIKISCLVGKEQGHDAVRAIHKAFFPDAKAPEDVLVNEKVGY